MIHQPNAGVLGAGLLLAVLVGAGPSRAAAELDGAAAHVSSYIERVLAADWDAAAAHWDAGHLVAAGRLGLHVQDLPLKVDGDSPLWRARSWLVDGRARWRLEPPEFVEEGLLNGMCRVALVIQDFPDEVRHPYHLIRNAGRWRLVSPVRWVADHGPVVRGRFVEVCDRRPGTPPTVPSFLTAQLDSCILDMAGRLDLSAEQVAWLAGARLGYLLTAPADVAVLAGAPTVGVANLQQDMVVTHHPCHAHELAHLLAGLWLRDLPLYTLPLLQEGLAVHLGGRWGRHPRVLDRLGRTSLQEGWLTLDGMLARADFLAMSADLTYPAAGAFTGFVLEEFGARGLGRAYRACSGSAADVTGWTAAEVADRLATALATPWSDLKARFAAYLRKPVQPSIEPGYWPRRFSPRWRLAAGRLRAEAEGNGGFHIHASHGAPAGILLFGGDDPTPASNELFAEHLPSRPYRGETHGLVFSPDEVKLYDYRRQMLIALHAQGFWPVDDLVRDAGRLLGFRIPELPAGPGEWTLIASPE